MIFESPVLSWLILASLLIGLPLLLLFAVSLARLFRVQSGYLPFILFVATGLLAAYGAASYLEGLGDDVDAEVLDKKEQLVYYLDGSWIRQMLAQVKYSPAPGATPVTIQLNLLQSRFDEIRKGDFVQLRHADMPGLFSLTRLEGQDVQSQVLAQVTDRPFFLILALGLLAVLAARLMAQVRWSRLIFLAAIATFGAWWISDVVLPVWEQVAIRMSSLNTVGANVRQVRQPDLGTGPRAWIFDKLFASYDLVLLNITPLGRPEPLMSIDVVDPGSTIVKPGDAISVQYSPSNPRIALVADASRTYLWKNSLLITVLVLIALLGLSAVAFPVQDVKKQFKALLDRLPPHPPGPPPPPPRPGSIR